MEADVTAERDVMWVPWDVPGLEHLHFVYSLGGVDADGLIVGMAESLPFRARYRVRCDRQWRVREVRVSLLGPENRSLRLHADGAGCWRADSGEPVPELDGCIDVDISATPFTNTLPIQRLKLQTGASADLQVAYVNVPELRLEKSAQRYTRLDGRSGKMLYRFESLADGFMAELPVDADGLVSDYPELFRRVWSG